MSVSVDPYDFHVLKTLHLGQAKQNYIVCFQFHPNKYHKGG